MQFASTKAFATEFKDAKPAIRRITVGLDDIHYTVPIEDGKKQTPMIGINGVNFKATGRTLNSLLATIGQSTSVFNLFTPEEVFGRVIQRGKADEVVFTWDDTKKEALAFSAPKKLRINTTDVEEIVSLNPDLYTGFSYHEGRLFLRSNPTVELGEFSVGSDKHNFQVYTEIPLDGWGNPSTYMGIIRLICSNGGIAMTKAFRKVINLGKRDDQVVSSLRRVIETAGDSDNALDLKNRITESIKWSASMEEYYQLAQMVFHRGSSLESQVGYEFTKLGGRVFETYGISGMSSLSSRIRSNIPVPGVSVYDLLNFATEAATHAGTGSDQNRLQGMFGNYISRPSYDLEGVLANDRDAQDRFFTDNNREIIDSLIDGGSEDEMSEEDELLASLNQ